MRTRFQAILLLVMLVLSSAPLAAQQRAAPATRPTAGAGAARPARPAAADPHVAAAVQAVDANTLAAFAKSLEPEVLASLADLNKLDVDRVTTLAAFREFGRYFARLKAPTPADRETLKWLAVQPKLLPVLMTAVADADAPENVLAILSALRADKASAGEQGERLNEYADLATAVCVVWDAAPTAGATRPPRTAPTPGPSPAPAPAPVPAPGPATTEPAAPTTQSVMLSTATHAPDPVTAVKRFTYYSNSRNRLQCDFKTLPWQIAIYSIDSTVSDDDIAWAAQNYATRRKLSRAYFEVPYDFAAFDVGKRDADALPYTLQNIRKFGGVCLDQAYFAANVGKALGQPAAVCTGQSGTQGELHAWIGFLQPAGKAATWNFYEGRYGAMMFWTGQVVDPQGGPSVSDADVCLLGELTLSTPDKRLASSALCKVRDLVSDDRAADVYMKAINLSPGNRPAWMGLADLGAARKLTLEQINRIAEVVQRFAVERYPDFAFAVYRRIISGRNVDEQLVAINSIARQFALRPDLVATVRLAQGDLLRTERRTKEALAAYTDAMSDAQRTGPVLPQAMERVDAMLRASGETKRLLSIYRDVWGRTPTPQPSGYADVTPFCVIGHRYAALLKEMGEASAATGVEQRLAAYEKVPPRG